MSVIVDDSDWGDSKPMKLLLRICALLCFLSMFLSAPTGGAELPAFPGAEGFGAVAVGGRGGEVIKVTTLESSGPGSLQAACEKKRGKKRGVKSGLGIKLKSHVERNDWGHPLKGLSKEKTLPLPECTLRILHLLGADVGTGCLGPFAPATSSVRLTISSC